MIRTLSKLRKDPDRALAHVRAICTAEQLKNNTIFSRMSTFSGKNEMSPAQLDYMMQCAKETRDRKTW